MAKPYLLYYITDRSQFPGSEAARRHAVLEKIAEAADAGVDYIQLREKDLCARELEILGREALAAVRAQSETRLLINSRTDVALAVGADGVHLRSEDVASEEVRRVVDISGYGGAGGKEFLVAASCHSAAEVLRAQEEGADFAIFAPVFGKSRAPGVRPTGLDALRAACQAKIPVVALGAITLENAASCLQAGASGIAAIRLFQEHKIEAVVRAVRGVSGGSD